MQHVSQVAEALGLPAPPAGDPARLAADCTALLDAWLAALHGVPWERLAAPTPARGRSLLELAVNVFHPFELLPEAWTDERFPWEPERDPERVARIANAALLRWARGVADDWRAFAAGAELDTRDPQVRGPRGELPYSALLDAQRTHAAFHLRQLAAVLGRDEPLLAELPRLELPAAVF